MKKENLKDKTNSSIIQMSILDIGGNIITPKQFRKAIDKARQDYNTKLYESRKTILAYILYHPVY